MIESIIPLHDNNLELKPTPGKSTLADQNTDSSGAPTCTPPLPTTTKEYSRVIQWICEEFAMRWRTT